MLITKEKVREALDAFLSGGSQYEVDRYLNAGSVPVKVSYLMEWYSAYFRDISPEERKEAEDVRKAAWRSFTQSDWDYVTRNASGVYSKMSWDQKKKKYLNQLRQNLMLDEIKSFLKNIPQN